MQCLAPGLAKQLREEISGYTRHFPDNDCIAKANSYEN